MSPRIVQKLNSKRGVSVVLALFLLMVCAFAGTAALTAARTNVGKSESSREIQQQYLSASSAAKLIIDELRQNSSLISASYSSDSAAATIVKYNMLETPTADTLYYLIWNEVKSSMQSALYHDNNVSSARNSRSGLWSWLTEPGKPADISFKFTIEDDAFDEVTVTLKTDLPGTSKKDGNMHFSVKCEDYKLEFDVGIICKVTLSGVDNSKADVTFEVSAGEIMPM